MKLTWIVSCLALVICQAALAEAIVPVNITKIYAPLGYDNQDRAQIVVTGTLPTDCYRLTSTIAVLEGTKTIRITQYATPGQNYCTDPARSYQQVVELGELKSGTYHLYSSPNVDRSATATLIIRKATTPDFAPAPVTDAYVSYNVLHLSGVYSDPCLSLDKVDVDYQTDRNVISAQPSINECSANDSLTNVPFSVDVPLDPARTVLFKGPFLLHVRTSNGFIDKIQVQE